MLWRFKQPDRVTSVDAQRFLTALNSASDFFEPRTPLLVARAPGRLDLMGGIADYSGSLVLELPLEVATWAAIQFTSDASVSLFSPGVAEFSATPHVTFPLTALQMSLSEGLSYEAAHMLLTTDPAQAWAAYVAGVLLVLQRERGLHLDRGVRCFIYSEVPAGKGVSSSAALEVATMRAVCALYNLSLDGRELALLCQQVENLIVGAPCGIMDQMTSACGEQDSLLTLLCQPAELLSPTALPHELEVWGLDSGIRHAVSGADYRSVRIGAFMGYRIIAGFADLPVEQQESKRVSIDDPIWHGYLANISPSLWETTFCDRVPLELDGASFLDLYGGSTDSVTSIDPDCIYAIRQPTAHPIYEHMRVRLFRSLLAQTSVTEEQLLLLGELLYQSHASYSACGLGSFGTDKLVELVRRSGPVSQLYGAKITGGGSGGTVAVLARRGADKQIERIVEQYTQETGLAVTLLRGSSPGAMAWGSQQLVTL